ncbi:hypothetical protein PMAYCL1PPCAC_09827, partial [Pristionchus mayeri]
SAMRRLIFFICFLIAGTSGQDTCTRKPHEAKGERRPGNNGYAIEVSDAAGEESQGTEHIVPGEMYKISIRGWRTQYTVQTFRGFVLTAHLAERNAEDASERPAGKFELIRGGDARMAPVCRSAGVSHSNLRPKTSIHVLWKAPEISTGCVVFRASVIESKYAWYSEESMLTKKICVKDGYTKLIPSDDPALKCCACDQAKYELEFIGIWSKDTHPRDYPTLLHLTHFTDMLGGSHSRNYSLWKIGEPSTDGMKEIAEWGNTYTAEKEAKEKASELRTLMKIKGLWYPEVQGRTKSAFVVNKYHHLVSFATMFGPSPDWCVGLSSVNLCLPDCSWVGERSFDLTPFDAGTDDGETYMSPNQPAEPRHPVRWITTNDHTSSPFYDESTKAIPPLARVVLRRTEIVSSRCQSDKEYQVEAHNITNTSEDEEYRDRRECSMSEWEPWSLCSATCGKGIRMRSRVFLFPIKAQMFSCHRQTTERQFCNAKINECADSDTFNAKCATSSWGGWSSCSVKCGHGYRSRNRTFLAPEATQDSCKVQLTLRDLCVGENGDDCSVKPDPLCQTTEWSEWSPCSTSCDEGVRIRTRLLFFIEHELRCSHVKLMEKDQCSLQSCRRFIEQNSDEICQEKKEEGQCKGVFPRYWFDSERGVCERFTFTGCKGNRNQFMTDEECKRACVPGYESGKAQVPNHQLINEFGQENVDDGGDPVPCGISEWSPWGNCSVTCGRGKRTRTRHIEMFPRNGGAACPDLLTQELHCTMPPCPLTGCRAGSWSRWSSCSALCGDGHQFRRRRILKPHDIEDCGIVDRETRACSNKCDHRV